jgi:hypothetical protein
VRKIVIGLAGLLFLLAACTSRTKTAAGQANSSAAPSILTASPFAAPGSLDGNIRTAADIARLGLPLPFPGEEMTVSTDYVPVADSSYEGVYTGVSPSDPTEGMIIVISDEANASKSPFAPSRIVMETGTGALTITQVIGPELMLRDAHGARHTFNVLTDAFS